MLFGHVRSNALLVFQNLKRAFTISLKISRKIHEKLCDRHLSRTKRAFVFFKHVRSNALLVFAFMEKGICYLIQKSSKFEIVNATRYPPRPAKGPATGDQEAPHQIRPCNDLLYLRVAGEARADFQTGAGVPSGHYYLGPL